MTDDDFAKSIGAVQVNSSDDDFAKSIGAVPIQSNSDGLFKKNLKNAGGALAGIGDMVIGIPKMGAQGALALAARAMAGKGVTLNDTWKAAGEELNDNPYVPDIGKLTGTTQNPGYQAINYPFQKLGEGIDYGAQKTEQGLTPLIGARSAGDMAGQVSMLGNAFGADLGVRALHGAGKGVKEFLKKNETTPTLPPEVTADEIGAVPYTSQDELPFTNSVEDIAGQRNAQGNQADLFNNNQGAPAVPYDPTARVPTSAQNELPLQNSVQDVANQASNPNGQMDMFGGAQNAVSRDPMSEIPEITPQVALRKALDAEDAGKQAEAAFWRERAMEMVREQRARGAVSQGPIHVNDIGTASDPATMDALTRSTQGVSYENVPPDGIIPRDSTKAGLEVPQGNLWERDENGIPVRKGLPTDTPDLSTTATVQGILNQDTGARNDLGNAIQEANGPKTGPDEHFGAGPLETPSQPFNNIINKGPGKNQRGSAPMLDDLTRAAADLVSKAGDAFGKVTGKLVGMLPEDHMSKVSGKDMIYKPESGEKVLPRALAQGSMDTHLWKNFQSGLALAAEKTGSVALKHVGEWLNWSDKRTHMDNKQTVNPIHGMLKKLPQNDFDTLHKMMLSEQGSGKRFSDADLSGSLSSKGVEAYKALRGALDASWQRSVATRKVLGLPAVTREQAYHASLHHGDFKQSFYDKSGKLVWHVASGDKLAQLKAESWIKKNIPGIDWDRSKPYFAPESVGVNVPRDIMSAYQHMMQFLDKDDPTTTLISDTINKYNAQRGLEAKSFDERFLEKSNIPGFEGNKLWLSQKENSKAFMNAQVKYLRDSNHWNNLQEALAQMKPILSNKTLIKQQPNIMAVAAAHVSRELGITGNKLAPLEASLAKATGYVPGVPKIGIIDGKPVAAYGVSRGNVYKGVNDVKTATYLTMLGANIPYMITTPLQAVMSIAQHRALTTQGFTHNVMKTTINSLTDVAAGLAKHMASSMTGKDVKVPMSDLGGRILKYAEQNGILDKTVMDETGDTRGHAILDPLKKTLGQTITAPEKIARFSTFVAFAHHLMDGGKLSEADAFKKAEDFTNHSLTSMRRADKPLIVDKLGTAGNLGYVFKSYLFNEYNQLSQFAGLARKGNTTPLLAHLGLLFTLGGALALPGVNEMDGAYDLWKTAMANTQGEHTAGYKPDIGVKGAILRDLPTWASIGTASDVTGTNLGTRFSTQVADLRNPLSDVAVPIQEGKELMSFKDWAIDPTMRNAMQAAHANIGSTGKGMMETHLNAYKNINPNTPDGRNPNGTQSYRKSSDINDVSTDYKRTPSDEAKRSLGMYSDQEYKTKQIRYANEKESERIDTAYNKMMKLAVSAGVAGDAPRAKIFAQKALELDPDGAKFNKKLNQSLIDMGTTPEERDKMKASNILELRKVQRATSH